MTTPFQGISITLRLLSTVAGIAACLWIASVSSCAEDERARLEGNDDARAVEVHRIERPPAVDPALADEKLFEGQRLFRERKTTEARAAFQASAEADPGRAEAFYLLGHCYVVHSVGMSYSRAIESFHRALQLDPDYLPCHWGIGYAAYGLSDYETARLHFEKVTSGEDPRLRTEQRGEALHFLGVMDLNEGRAQQAVRHFLEAKKIYPDFADTRYQLGLAEEALQKEEEAVRAYEEALVIHPSHAACHHRLASLYRRLGQPEKAARAEHIHELLNKLTDNISTRFLKDLDTRLELQRELIRIQPENHVVRIEHAKLLLEARQALEAARVLDSLISDMPEVADAYVLRAVIALRMGDRTKAKDLIERLLRSRPEYPREKLPEAVLELLKS